MLILHVILCSYSYLFHDREWNHYESKAPSTSWDPRDVVDPLAEASCIAKTLQYMIQCTFPCI